MARAAQVQADDVAAPEEEEVSLRDQIIASRDEILAREEIEGREAAPPAGQAEGDQERIAVARRPDGKFAPRAAAAEGAGAEPAAAAAAQGADRAGVRPADGAIEQPVRAAPAAAGVDSSLAPQGWSAAGKAKWGSIDPEVRAEISRREIETARLISRHDEQRQMGAEFHEIARNYAPLIQRSGVTPARIFQDFLGIMNVLSNGDMQSKAALLRDVAMRNGLDMRTMLGMQPGPPQPGGGAPPQPQPSQGPPPQAQSIHPAVLQMAQEWNQHKQQLQREAQEKKEREEHETLTEIMAFRAQPTARFFDAVKDQMIALLQYGAASELQDAYEQAIWSRPDIRAILLSEQQAAARSGPEAKRAAAEAARRKAVSVRGGSGSAPAGAAPERSLRAELEANFAEARSRV